MIAYHYPPCKGSSGLQRTLSLTRYLPAQGWAPVVLTVKPSAYPHTSDDQLGDIPASVPVERAFALDTQTQLSIRGRYLKWMALPDFWVSWLFWAIPIGLRIIRKYKPKIIWSTYPIATAHLIAFVLNRLTGVPWVADFRDPMTEVNPVSKQRRPADAISWRVWSWIERLTVKYCTRAVFTTEGARGIYTERYPEIPTCRWAIISNGYDEEQFLAAQRFAAMPSSAEHRITLLHSGVLYRSADRDPATFFAALATLRRSGKISPSTLRVVLRASGYEGHYQTLIQENGIGDIVFLEPAIPYREALAEMLGADGLLIFQGYTSNPAIPAKLYEYLRAGRPIFAMVDSEGDTAKTLRAVGVGTMVPLDSENRIVKGLLEFLQLVRDGKAPVMDSDAVKTYARDFQAQQLAKLLDAVAIAHQQ